MSPLNYRHQPKLAELSKHSGLKNYPRRIATLFGKAAQARDVLPAHLQGKSRLTILHDYDGEQTFYTNDRKWLPLIADFRKRAVPFVVHEMLLGSDVTPSPTRPGSIELLQSSPVNVTSSCSRIAGTSAESKEMPTSMIDSFDFSLGSEGFCPQVTAQSPKGRKSSHSMNSRSSSSSSADENPLAGETSDSECTSDDSLMYDPPSPQAMYEFSSISPPSSVPARRVERRETTASRMSSGERAQRRELHNPRVPATLLQYEEYVPESSRSSIPTSPPSSSSTPMAHESRSVPVSFTPITLRQEPQMVTFPPSPPSSTRPVLKLRKPRRSLLPPVLRLEDPKTPLPPRRSRCERRNANASSRMETSEKSATRERPQPSPLDRYGRSERRQTSAATSLLDKFNRVPLTESIHSLSGSAPRRSSKNPNNQVELAHATSSATSSKRRRESGRCPY